MKIILGLLLILTNVSLQAAEGRLTVTWSSGPLAEKPIIESINTLLEEEANKELPTTTGDQYSDGLYHSQLATTSTNNTSAVYNSSSYNLSLNSSFGWRGGSITDVMSNPSSITGIGLSTAVGFSFPLNNLFGDLFKGFKIHLGLMHLGLPPIASELSGDMHHYQMLISYRMLANSFWNGLSITTGIIRNELTLKIHVDLDETASSGGLTGHLRGAFDLNTNSEVTTIPLFISTGITPISWLNLFASFGGNYSKGSSDVSALLEAVVTYDGSSSLSDAHYSLNGSYQQGYEFDTMFIMGVNFLFTDHINLALQYAKSSNDGSLGLNFSVPF